MKILTSEVFKVVIPDILCFLLQGIEYLVSNGLLNETPEDVAEFLYTGEGLNKTQIGNYLGEK